MISRKLMDPFGHDGRTDEAIVLNVVADDRAACGIVSRDLAIAVVAALGADPETIGELEQALGRAISTDEATDFFGGWPAIVREHLSPGTAAVGIDLPGRLLVQQDLPFELETTGHVYWREGGESTDIRLFYGLPDEWLLADHWRRWRRLAESRRRDRRLVPACDARRVLFHEAIPYVVEQCRTPQSKIDPLLDIHANWLLTPQADLANRPPRDVLLARQDTIDRDLQYQEYHWARRGECPPGLERDAWAFRFAGFGTHEFVVYHGLMRHLIEVGWQRHQTGEAGSSDAEVDHLRREQQDWLHTPQDDLAGHTPAQVIARERARLPLVASAEHVMLDHDCPLCRLAAEQPGPIFWHLDLPDWDQHFAFSTCENWNQWSHTRGADGEDLSGDEGPESPDAGASD